MKRPNKTESRRQLLKFLAGSPALAYVGFPAFTTMQSTRRYAGRGDGLIASPDDAINVFDFERVAEKVLPAAHWGYLATGTDDDLTIQANRDGFTRFQLRPRRLVDVREIDMSVDVLGTRWPTPIVIAPTGSNGAFHADGEIAVARAAKAKTHLQMLSNVSSHSVEDVNTARGEPVWFQLYPRATWDVTKAVVSRAERAGCPAIVLTVDLLGGSNRETVKRFAMKDERECSVCHLEKRNTPNYDGLELPDNDDYPESLTWDYVRQVRDHTTMKVLIKGIVTAEDARLAVEAGVDGIIVSNHGGRAEASRRSTIECLPEIVDAVSGRIAVLIDGGFRRGTDFFKALALGATAVCIGRPYLWGLSAFGQAGVEAVLEVLRRELEIVMKQSGTTSIREITPRHVVAATR
ncbi:MAG TPA: alpha-hydroxy acid oxidase [Vicinamibacteria bacterium]|nr:alpha-hydroxy acid oxidase [Vicinamibacteria bacterium]